MNKTKLKYFTGALKHKNSQAVKNTSFSNERQSLSRIYYVRTIVGTLVRLEVRLCRLLVKVKDVTNKHFNAIREIKIKFSQFTDDILSMSHENNVIHAMLEKTITSSLSLEHLGKSPSVLLHVKHSI